MKCRTCKKNAVVGLKSHNTAFCEECYFKFFRRQIEKGIQSRKLLKKDDKILIAVSGGKDSLVLAYELLELGYNISALFLDLAIPVASESSRQHVQNFCDKYHIPLYIKDIKKEGFEIPKISKLLKRPVCSLCGKIKRYYFNRTTLEKGFDVLATGHNLDDEIGRLLSNVLRWDTEHLATQGPALPSMPGFCRKVKPLWRLTEFEIANYAFLRKIEPAWEPCPYSSGASFPVLKDIFHQLELKMPGRKLDFYQGFLEKGKKFFPSLQTEYTICDNCGGVSNFNNLCAICSLKENIKKISSAN